MAETVPLPADGHVHSEWSWDAPGGDMERTCARAVQLGVPAVAFTEHVDVTRWLVVLEELRADDHLRGFVASDGTVVPAPLDVEGYLAAVERCRDLFPSLRILTGVELGEPHWYQSQVRELLSGGRFDRVLGSLHSLPVGTRFAKPRYLYRHRPADDVVRAYLAEVSHLIRSSDAFTVLAHLDYPLRYWPPSAGPLEVTVFEDEFRDTLGVLAASGRALEVNTRGPASEHLVAWWRAVGGSAVTFGSDAHDPIRLGRGFERAAAMVEAHGFRPGRHPHEPWTRIG